MQIKVTFGLLILEPSFRIVCNPDQRKHDRNLNENADYGSQCHGALCTEQCNGNSNSQLKEVGGTDHPGRGGYAMR